MDAASELLKLAEEKFGELTLAEKKLFRAAAKGEGADYTPRSKKPIDPAHAAKWGPSRALLADRIAWLCTDKQALQFVTSCGILIKGARIEQDFDLPFAKVVFPLAFRLCKFTANINLPWAHIAALHLSGTFAGSVLADGLRVDKYVSFCDGFRIEGGIRLPGANVGGDLVCTKGQIINKNGLALFADGLKVVGSINLRRGFKAEGEVSFTGATVGVSVECDGAQLINSNGNAVMAEDLKVGGSINLRGGFKAEGRVCLSGATIGGDLDCSNSQFINKGGDALQLSGLRVDRNVFLRDGFKAEGEVCLIGSVIGQSLDCSDSHLINKDGIALDVSASKVEGYVMLHGGFKAEGEVDLIEAVIGRSLQCHNGQFINRDGHALCGDGLRVKGSVMLGEGFNAKGEVRLINATVGGSLQCDNGKFINRDRCAFCGEGLKVAGVVSFTEGFQAEGTVYLVGAEIDGHFCLRKIGSPQQIILDLGAVKIGTLRDEQESWPDPGRLLLHGLEYTQISEESPRDSQARIKWLRLQDGFSPQPYEQLANVLRESGDDVGARDVLIAKNKDKTKRTKLTWAQWPWYRLFGPLVGYGHRPWLAVPLAFVIILFGSVFFKEGYSHELMMPLSETHPVFNSLVYSIDTFVPVVDLHQVKYWLPNAKRGSEIVSTSSQALCTGGLLLFWLWLEIACGWILTTLFLVGLTGVIRT